MPSIGIGLSVEPKQALKINPVQLQKIEILQMNNIELEERIRTELMENPVLEISDESMGDTGNGNDNRSIGKKAERPIDDTDLPNERYDDYDYWDSHSLGYSESSGNDRGGIEAFESFYRTEETLGEYLLKQLGGIDCSDDVKRAAGYIIFSLDSNGRFDTELETIAELAKCGIEDAEKALLIVQGMDPAGVGARSVEECLCLQLDTENDLAEDVKRVIQNHLMEIATGNVRAVTEDLHITAERLIRIIEVIRTLNPKPCSQFTDNLPVQYVNPDVYAKLENGEVVVALAWSQPDLCLSSYYTSLYRNSSDKAVIDYLKERIESATRLIQNIEQRNKTILRVTQTIMRHQSRFFEHGTKAMTPLTMQEVADELEISISTVSRAVSGKYIHCGGGTYAIKHFFTSEVGGVAKDSVIERIKALISDEDPAHPLSDQKIADILSSENIVISRRTVAKYRDGAGILPTSMRRKR